MTYLMPTDSELEILQIMWDQGDSSVRSVNDLLNTRREVGYTTTLKLMQIMFEKGLLTRDASSKTHIYTAVVKEKDTKDHLITSFVNATFQGSAMDLVLQALGNSKSTKEELNDLKSLISQLENQK